MHEDFPADPFTIGVTIVAILAGAVGFVGFPGNSLLGAVILFAVVAVPLLLVEWLGFAVYNRFGRSGT